MALRSRDGIGRARSIWRLVAAPALLVLLVAACSPREEPQVVPLTTAVADEAGGAPTATPAPTPAPTPDDPYAIPDDAAHIDEAYIQQVVDALAVVQGEAFHQFAADGEISPAVEEVTAHAHAFHAYEGTLLAYEEILERRPDLHTFYDEPGDPRVVLHDIIHRGRDCTFIEVRQDFSDVFLASMGLTSRRAFYTLQPYNDPTEPDNPNPTPWKYSLAFYDEADGPDPENPCEGYD